MNKTNGFTLIEIVVVMVLIAILAVVAVPKYLDLTQEAKIASTQAALGAVRSALHITYAERAIDPNIGASFPSSLSASDFATSTLPLNQINGQSGIEVVNSAPAGTTTSGSNGFWYMVSDGQAGAYSDGTINTGNW